MVGLGLVMRGHARLARYAAPAAFLLAATIAILLVRSGLENGEPAAVTTAPVTATTTVEEPSGTTTAGTTTTDAGAEFYEIQPGDTLAVVAEQHGTTVEQLLAVVAEQHGTTVEQLLVLNPDLDPVALTIGERIRVK